MTHGRTIVAAPKHMFEKTRGSGPVVNAYRPDIDGLRAIAVGAVILFHLDVGIMKGGFIGVDVFFVISGYLITGLLQSEIDAGRFSILRFYDRRIRRILPALFAVILAASAAAVFLFFAGNPRLREQRHSYDALFVKYVFYDGDRLFCRLCRQQPITSHVVACR